MNPSPIDVRISPSQPIPVERLSSTIRTLITLDPTEAPVVSCYLDPATAHAAISERESDLLAVVAPAQRDVLADAFDRVRAYLSNELAASTRGVAVFARGGNQPMFVAMQFRVPLPVHVGVGEVPNVYHLVELKDTYDRYVVFITSERYSRIIEIDLGAATKELWTQSPDLRDRVRDKWTRDHYQRRRRDRDHHVIDEEVALVEKLVLEGKHAYLMLAGPAHRTAFVRSRLSPALQQRLVDTHAVSTLARIDDVVAQTLDRFIATEQQESLDAVSELVLALRRGGLAVAGTQRTIDALHSGRADLLVLAKTYPSGPAWQCRKCGWIDMLAERPATCSACDAVERVVSVERREALVRLAERSSVEIELVAESRPLMSIGGVGCLLRFEGM